MALTTPDLTTPMATKLVTFRQLIRLSGNNTIFPGFLCALSTARRESCCSSGVILATQEADSPTCRNAASDAISARS